MQKVLVLGASTNPARFSNKAIKSLRRRKFEVLAIGNMPGRIEDIDISVAPILDEQIHTILIYLAKENLEGYYKYILDLHPQQVIFNPGTENPEFKKMLDEEGIKVVMDCALVLINSKKLRLQ